VLIVLAAMLAPSAATGQSVSAVSITAPTLAQASEFRVTARGGAYAPNRLDVVKSVAAQCPGLVLQDHAFTDAVVMELRRLFPAENWGRNGKRGNRNDPSHDAIFFPTSQSPFGGAVIDIIGSAGAPNASPAWIDQTDPTIAAGTTGVWVAPSGRFPACLSDGDGGVDPVRPPPPVVTPPPATVDLAPVLVALAKLQADVDELKNRPQPEPAPPDLGLVNEFVDDMIGNGPGDDAPNHITDILQRLDANRAEVLAAIERVFAWLRSRGALRF
jgi:hypothetical protein